MSNHGVLGKVEVAAHTGEERAPLDIRRSWAQLIRQVYEVDPLRCAGCGRRMKIIAVIEPACADTADRRPAVVPDPMLG